LSLLGRALRLVFMPAVRVADQLRQSGQRLSDMRKHHRMQMSAVTTAQATAQATAGSTAPDPNAPMNPAQKFEHLYVQRGWSEPMLQQQLLAVRRTKRSALLGCCIGTGFALVMLAMAPLWALVILVPAAAGLTSYSIAMALKYALFQAQLEQRELISLRDYLCRADMLSHLLGVGVARQGG
jgi:hypothetical protein